MTNAQIRERWPGLATRADNRSRAAAIRLHCLDCCNGQSAIVRECHIVDCWLWPLRMGGKYENREQGASPRPAPSVEGSPTWLDCDSGIASREGPGDVR